VDHHKVTIPGHLVDGVVHVPFGAHPTQSPGFYEEDREHTGEYVRAVRDGRADDYLARYVRGPKTHADYVMAVGIDRLMALMREDSP
jgi:glutaconate CoA-transferase subunit A